MDRNTITGLVVIALILIGYSYFMSPSKEELKAMHVRDSIARVEAQRAAALEKERQADFAAQQQNPETQQAIEAIFKQDSLVVEQYTLENNKIKLHINTQGGCIDYVDLKGYRTHDSLPLILWKDHKSSMGLNFYARNKQINTADLIFVPNTNQKELNAEGTKQVLAMRAYVDENKYLEFEYKLAPDSYTVDFNINTYNLNDVIASNTNFLTLYWGVDMPQLEKSRDFESRYTGVYYNFSNNDVEHLSLTGDEKVDLPTSVKWVAYKQQFFSSILIANESFPNVLVSTTNNTTPGFLKTADAEISLPYSGKAIEKYDMRFFFGPNSYPVLREYGKDIELPQLINLGWKWIAWFNRYVVIPIFNFLEANVTLNYGLIIFLLTLIIKLVLFPLTYKSYMSQAKMRVLKPQIDEINKKIPADKAMERQQAVMKLYKKAGVNPMGGCLPMLLQMPILIALFYFFPGAIELRQKSFLWATDLASYDSIATLPFTIPFYGNHVSLFCLLMTITNILYMWYNSKNQPQNDQMKGMQTMMYIMPIMFLFIFNSYSSGLSYYYFIATLITIVQTWAIRKFVNDEKLLKQIELAKTKPVKKSKFQQKLEEMQRMQEQRMKQMPKKK
ncbi:membrane protein insertase YidC [Butyricimonas faecalis]|uniref:Membrane protein insertase YidC n=1 Tax=Butyricimonas faecalis TaxID=2093856 RepID=A0A3Q9IPA2_9BACT|nr:membrane protein insertase YidC [Butyricimonas faecalis]AZS29845.1 membrane protein insertase YidC [Butyricimonas faecalis]